MPGRLASLTALIGALALGLTALALIVTAGSGAGASIASSLIASALTGVAAMLAAAGNILYVFSLARRPLPARVMGALTIAWGVGHMIALLSLPPLKSPASSIAPPILAALATIYIIVGLGLAAGWPGKRLY